MLPKVRPAVGVAASPSCGNRPPRALSKLCKIPQLASGMHKVIINKVAHKTFNGSQHAYQCLRCVLSHTLGNADESVVSCAVPSLNAKWSYASSNYKTPSLRVEQCHCCVVMADMTAQLHHLQNLWQARPFCVLSQDRSPCANQLTCQGSWSKSNQLD